MSDQQAQPQAQPAAPQPPQHQAEQSGGDGAAGGFFQSFVDDFAQQLGVEWSELTLTDGPWLEQTKIGWRVHNSGNKEVASHNCFYRVSDSTGTLFEKDESQTEKVGPDEYKDFDFTIDEFNTKLKAEFDMKGGGSFRDDERYQFDLFVDTSSGYDKGGSIQFGLELAEQTKQAKSHGSRPRVERKKKEGVDSSEDFDDPESEDVRHLQETLQKLGYYSGQVDGRYGDTTEEAVAQFKSYQGLTADGKIVGDRTWAAIHAQSDEHDEANAPQKFRKAKGFTY